MKLSDTAGPDQVGSAVARAAEVLSERWSLTLHAAEMALCDIAAETGVDVKDLAHLISTSRRNRVG